MKVKRQNLKFTNLGLYEKQLEASRLVKKVLGKEYLKIYKRDWDSRNSEYVKSYRKDYYEANKEKCKQNGTLNWKSKKRASVKWADRKAILEFYREAKRLTKLTGIQFHVDHVIPLNGKNVSGLHVETNLQTIPWLFNNMKYNSFTDDIC
jgi:hypothetical protein